MTIHWKALDKHILMVPLVFRFNHFWEENGFYFIFLTKYLSLKSESLARHMEQILIWLATILLNGL
jgi:hypothetical protein